MGRTRLVPGALIVFLYDGKTEMAGIQPVIRFCAHGKGCGRSSPTIHSFNVRTVSVDFLVTLLKEGTAGSTRRRLLEHLLLTDEAVWLYTRRDLNEARLFSSFKRRYSEREKHHLV